MVESETSWVYEPSKEPMTTEEALAYLKRGYFGEPIGLREAIRALVKAVELNDNVLQDLQITIESYKLPTIEHCVDYNSAFNDGLDRAWETFENILGHKE